MADIVNLRRRRKQKVRAEKERQAEANRLKFGRPRHERQRLDAVRELEEQRLDGVRRDDGGEPGSGT